MPDLTECAETLRRRDARIAQLEKENLALLRRARLAEAGELSTRIELETLQLHANWLEAKQKGYEVLNGS